MRVADPRYDTGPTRTGRTGGTAGTTRTAGRARTARTTRTARTARTARAAALAGLLGAACLLGPASPAAADEVYAVGPAGLAVVGHGFGHGHGMGQYGAQGAALKGVPYEQILAHYYPGTAFAGTPLPATIRVLISEDNDNALTVRPDPGLAVASGASRWVLPTGPSAWRIVADPSAGQHVELFDGAWKPWTAPDGRNAFASLRLEGPARIRLDLPGGGGRAYRGTLTAVGAGGTALRTVDTLDLEQYLWGVVPRESPSSWQPEALKAQAVAARTYAAHKRAYSATPSYDICSTTACQVYAGSASYGSSGALTEQEPASTTAAVNDTGRRILTYGGRVAFTEFSASTGGWNTYGGVPYLAAGPDPWDDFPGNPVHTWTATMTPAALRAAYPTVGEVRALRVTGRDGNGEWGGRITTLVVEGSTGSVSTTGNDVRSRLGLRSQWWGVTDTAILAHWRGLGAAAGVLGGSVSGEYDVPGGRAQDFERGRIHWSGATGARETHGLVLAGYLAAGGPGGVLGLPVTDELGTPDAAGRYNHFERGSVYWTGATGAHEVHGAIRDAWSRLGWERSPLGYPVTDEIATPDAVGRFSAFERGSVYWTPPTGAHEVRGAIRDAWSRLGWERSALGYPRTDEYDVPGGRRSDFQGGSITWTAATGATTVTPAGP